MYKMEERNVNVKVKESKTSDSHNPNSRLFGNMPRLTNVCFSVLILIINIFYNLLSQILHLLTPLLEINYLIQYFKFNYFIINLLIYLNLHL